MTAKHAYTGTMKALQRLGLNKEIETVDDVANRIKNDNLETITQVSLQKERVILKVNPEKICNWELHDRPENEIGDIEALAKDIEDNGQAQPCIVRPYKKDPSFDYELIVGERRWRAAKLRNLPLKIIIEDLTDQQAAIYQIAENSNRKDLSDYAKGMNYARLIEQEVVAQKDLEKVLNKNKVEISRLLSFKSIPTQIWDAIGDATKISARTASEIRSLLNKGEEYYHAVIQLAPRLREGKLGASNLQKEISKIVSGETKLTPDATEIRTSSGRHLFTWRKDSNGNVSISFPKDVRKYIDKDLLEQSIKSEIEMQLIRIDQHLKIKEEEPA